MNTSHQLESILTLARNEAKQQRSPILGTPHLFIAMIQQDDITASGVRALGHNPLAVRDRLRSALGHADASPDAEPQLTQRAAASLERAEALAESEGADHVGEQHLLTAILDSERDSFTLRALQALGIDIQALLHGLSTGTPILDRVGRDLTALAVSEKLDPLIGRREELRSLVRTLVRKKKNNPVLVGPAGVGKTAIVEGLARVIAAGLIAPDLRNTRLVELPTAALVADTKYRGQFEERLLGLVEEVKRTENVILFIDEIHTILRAGAVEGGALDAGNILKPALARGDIRVIGATTPEEYQRYIAQDAALERRFQPVWVSEPTPAESLDILRGLKTRYEEHHSVVIADEALIAAVQLSADWIPDRCLPDKALDLIDEACARARIPTISSPSEARTGLMVTVQTVEEVLCGWVGISARELGMGKPTENAQL